MNSQFDGGVAYQMAGENVLFHEDVSAAESRTTVKSFPKFWM
jgi:hypothetical protein